jgi:DNA-binding beta-propeller fold protein YncE
MAIFARRAMMAYLRLVKIGVMVVGLLWLTIFAIGLTKAQTVTGTITVEACEDLDAEGVCGPGGPLPAGVLACLENQSGQTTCQPAPATFTGLSTGVYTAALQFSGASQGYYPTTAPARITLSGCTCTGCQCSGPGCVCQCECQCQAVVRLGAVYPMHPKGVAVHTGLNKVYVAFQGPKINSDRPYPFVAVIDSATDQVIRIIPGGATGVAPGGSPGIGREPWGVAVSGDGQYVYAGSFGDGLISVINPFLDVVVTNLKPSAPFKPIAPAVNPLTGQVHFPTMAASE